MWVSARNPRNQRNRRTFETSGWRLAGAAEKERLIIKIVTLQGDLDVKEGEHLNHDLRFLGRIVADDLLPDQRDSWLFLSSNLF